MTILTFRDALASDLPALVALMEDDAFSKGREDASLPLDPAYLAALRAIDADPNQRLIVAEQDGAFVGSLQLSFLPGLSYHGAWRGLIEAVRIVSTHRGQGLGGAMIEWAIAQCRARNCNLVQLTSNKARTEAHRFYERLGFVASHVGMKLHLKD